MFACAHPAIEHGMRTPLTSRPSYQPYWAAKGHLLSRAGDTAPAAEALTIAIGLTTDEAVKDYLRGRLASLQDG